MAKSIRSKVKKRMRTAKRGVVKSELSDPTSKLGVREVQKSERRAEALSGYLKPEIRKRNAFRYDGEDAQIPQHNWRQGPDFRSSKVPDSGFAVVGTNRPKLGRFGGDAPSANVIQIEEPPGQASLTARDGTVDNLMVGTHQIVPIFASKKVKKKLKGRNKLASNSGADYNFRWT